MGKKKKIKQAKTISLQQKKAPTVQTGEKKKSLLPWILVLLIITVICFFPMLKNNFTNWDDEDYIVHNAMLNGPDWNAIFTQQVAANYHPLTMITLALNYQLSGLNPFSYFFVNLLLHLINSALVFYFIYQLSGKKTWIAFSATLLFAIHPMHVESVAWISERKDVLYTFFFLLSLIQYWKYVNTNKKFNYWICFLYFILSLLSKPAAIILPLILFLLDYWKGRTINRKIILEKLPFFLLAILFSVITLRIQSHIAMASLNVFPFWTRFFFACYGVMIYFLRFFIPYPLSTFHAFPPANQLGWEILISPLFILLLLIFLWYKRKNKIIVFGFLFFVFNLLLVLQIMSVGLTIVSERYTYVPYIGLAFMTGIFLNRYKIASNKLVFWGIPAIITIVFGYITFNQTKVWENSGTLWTNAIKYAPQSPYPRTNRAYYTIGLAKSSTDKSKSDSLDKLALEDCSIALQEDPKNISALKNSINILMRLNRNKEALADARSLTQYDPKDPAGYLSKGILYLRLNEIDSAMNDLNECLFLNPASDVALNLRGTLLVDNYQKFSEALSDFNKAIQINPSGEYYLHRSICYYRLGDIQNAKADAQTALSKNVTIQDSYRKLLNL